MLRTLAIIVALVAASLGGYMLSEALYSTARTTPARAGSQPETIDAPGRIEPGSGEFHLGAAILGQVAEIPVKVNDVVEESELLIRLDDEEARARLASAEAHEGLSRRERDAQRPTAGREDVTKEEDEVYTAERELIGARFELDAALAAEHKGELSNQQLAAARKRLADAQERVERERLAYAQAQAKSNLPTPNQFESALTAARAEVALAGTLLDKTRIRAPIGGTVFEVDTRRGEIVTPEEPLVVMGDMSVVRVKAEIDDGDVAKIGIGQKAVVRSINSPNVNFEGTVTSLAPSLGPPRIIPRGPLRPSDIEVREITIEIKDPERQLKPGMRVDALFKL